MSNVFTSVTLPALALGAAGTVTLVFSVLFLVCVMSLLCIATVC